MFLTYFTFILVPHLLFYQGASAQFYNEACVAECTRNAELCLISCVITFLCTLICPVYKTECISRCPRI
ncbi:hypothetical protein CRM22_010023 [Opisthorchis felineus]|nr:hypothetical protein CRM22_010023 [Opisthorchis felineus]TGZ57073.1 hypothetical protein CRM22_010023 [Opisthorchis felineus]